MAAIYSSRVRPSAIVGLAPIKLDASQLWMTDQTITGATKSAIPRSLFVFAIFYGGMVPLGGAIVRREIHEAFMTGPEHLVEFFHGYTYSGHPLACAAGLAALKVYADEGLLARARALVPVLEDLTR